MQLGGNPLARFWKITFEQLQDQVLEAGMAYTAELEDYRALLDSPEYRWNESHLHVGVGKTCGVKIERQHSQGRLGEIASMSLQGQKRRSSRLSSAAGDPPMTGPLAGEGGECLRLILLQKSASDGFGATIQSQLEDGPN